MAKRERGMGHLRRRKGCKNWIAKYYKEGRPIEVSTRTSVKQEAIQFLRERMVDSSRGFADPSDMRKIHYGHLREALLDHYRTQGHKSLQTLADGTETIWGVSALDDFFGYKAAEGSKPEELGRTLTQITTSAARQFVKHRQKEGVGNAFINRSLALLRRMLNLARQEGKITTVPYIEFLPEPKPRKGFVAQNQFNRLLAALPKNLQPLVTFLYYCGVRLGEAEQVQWSQVDLPAALIRLEHEQTKNSEPRIVPLPDVLIRMLESTAPKEGNVFCRTNLRKTWQRVCVAVGLGSWRDPQNPYYGGYDGLIIHDLRRSAIKNLVAAGVNEKTAMTISGHKTRSVFDRYNIVDEHDLKNAMRKVQAQSRVRGVRVASALAERNV